MRPPEVDYRGVFTIWPPQPFKVYSVNTNKPHNDLLSLDTFLWWVYK